MVNRRIRWLGLSLLVAMWLVTGCAKPPGLRGDMQSARPAERAKAIVRAVQEDDRQAIPLIVDRLADEDEAVRMVADNALKDMTGQDFGYRPTDSLYKRNQAINRWRQWLGEARIATTGRKGVEHDVNEGIDKTN